MPKGIYQRTEYHNAISIRNGFQKGQLQNRTEAGKKSFSEKMIGHIVSVETRRKIGLGNSISLRGYKHSVATKKKLSEMRQKEKHPRWVIDRTKLQKYGDTNKDRRSSAYRDWRLNVYKRDSYKCKINNSDCNGRIVAHHILSYTNFPELRYDINNGITLCHFHHPLKRQDEINLSPYFKELVGNVK